MATTSTSALFTRSWWLSNARGTPKRLPAASADSRRLVDSAVISKSSGSDCKAGMCASADRKSTRLNSSHSQISYAVFCLKKKKKEMLQIIINHLNAKHIVLIYV